MRVPHPHRKTSRRRTRGSTSTSAGSHLGTPSKAGADSGVPEGELLAGVPLSQDSVGSGEEALRKGRLGARGRGGGVAAGGRGERGDS